MDAFLTFKFLHIAAMFFAVAAAPFGEIGVQAAPGGVTSLACAPSLQCWKRWERRFPYCSSPASFRVGRGLER